MRTDASMMSAALEAVREALARGGEGIAEASAVADGIPESVAASARFAGSARHLSALRAALGRGDRARAERHLSKLEAGAVRPVANDRPHAVGDRVSVTRHRHGWGGMLEAEITSRSANAEGTWSYVALDDGGTEIEIGHTRDARRVR